MRKISIISLVALLLAVVQAKAQYVEVTYEHDNSVMNQFLTMETGAGALTPAAYYNTFHKSYQSTANATNKLVQRTAMMVAVGKEKTPAERIDSDYVERGKIEAMNIESRSTATDVTWASEKSKVNGKLEVFNHNINSILSSGGSHEDYTSWKTIYNCIETAIKYTQQSYLDMGQRKKEYLAIYRDIVKRNNTLVQQLIVWREGKKAQEAFANKAKIERVTSNAVTAQNCLRRWQTSFGVNGIHTGK